MVIVVIGDVMLDIEAAGCLRENQEGARVCTIGSSWRYLPGGAANVAAEIAKLGHRAKVFGAIGHDWAGVELCQLTGGFGTLSRCAKSTTVKLRARTEEGIVARVDLEDAQGDFQYPFPKKLDFMGGADAIVFSDYCKGMFGDYCFDSVRQLCASGVPTVIDPHPGSDPALWSDCLVSTPNRREFEAMGEICEWTAVTLGGSGVALHRGHRFVAAFDAQERVFHGDVVGAGDAFTAALTIRIAEGAGMERAVYDAMCHATEYVKRPRWA